MGETSEEGVCREVLEETGLHVVRTEFLFSLPNRYVYSGLEIPTMDMFYRCEVAETTAAVRAMDDAAEAMWIPISTDLAVVPREKPHTGAAAREQPRASPVIAT